MLIRLADTAWAGNECTYSNNAKEALVAVQEFATDFASWTEPEIKV